MVVLTLAGVGRSLAAVRDVTPQGFGTPGVVFHICHARENDPSPPADQAQHDCCDACALSAPLTLADAPSLTGPASAVHFVEHAHAMAWAPTSPRARTPRQSQGPPIA